MNFPSFSFDLRWFSTICGRFSYNFVDLLWFPYVFPDFLWISVGFHCVGNGVGGSGGPWFIGNAQISKHMHGCGGGAGGSAPSILLQLILCRTKSTGVPRVCCDVSVSAISIMIITTIYRNRHRVNRMLRILWIPNIFSIFPWIFVDAP